MDCSMKLCFDFFKVKKKVRWKYWGFLRIFNLELQIQLFLVDVKLSNQKKYENVLYLLLIIPSRRTAQFVHYLLAIVYNCAILREMNA